MPSPPHPLRPSPEPHLTLPCPTHNPAAAAAGGRRRGQGIARDRGAVQRNRQGGRERGCRGGGRRACRHGGAPCSLVSCPGLPPLQLPLLTHPPSYPPTCPPQNDIKLVYKKVEEGADVNFVFGRAYRCPEGYTPLMVACHRGRCVMGLLGQGRATAPPPASCRAEPDRPPPAAIPPCRLECALGLLRAGADPNYLNGAGDLTLFWAIDGGAPVGAPPRRCALVGLWVQRCPQP